MLRRPSIAATLFAVVSLLLAARPGLTQEEDDELTFGADEVETIDGSEAEISLVSPPIGNDEEALRGIYGDDPLFNTKLKIERHLGIYLVRFPHRDETERVEIDGRKVRATVWVSIGGREENDLACRAVRWLAFGRTKWAKGARGIFGEFEDLQAIELTFTNVRLRDTRKRRVKKKEHELLTIAINRRDFNKLKPGKLNKMVAQGQCTKAARAMFTNYSFNNKYFQFFKDNQ